MSIEIVKPSMGTLAGYVEALERGWWPDNVRKAAAAEEQLERIRGDAEEFVAGLDDPMGVGPAVMLPDGSEVKRLPGFARWIWDGVFCGVIGFRWQPGTEALPDYVLGHIGFAVVPWKRGNGYAKAALGLMAAYARAEGLRWVELTTDPENLASQRTIMGCGGLLVERFTKLPAYGGGEGLRFRILVDGDVV